MNTQPDTVEELCKPWEHHVGPPPDYESPLSAVYDAGIRFAEQALADLLGVERYEGGDGSEDFAQDQRQTLINILIAARLWDHDEDRPIVPTPQKPEPSPTGETVEGLVERADKLLKTGAPDWDTHNGMIAELVVALRAVSQEKLAFKGRLGVALDGRDHFQAEVSRLRAENEGLNEALGLLIPTAQLLWQNAEGCAVNHHSVDFELQGLPGWLEDCSKAITKARNALAGEG